MFFFLVDNLVRMGYGMRECWCASYQCNGILTFLLHHNLRFTLYTDVLPDVLTYYLMFLRCLFAYMYILQCRLEENSELRFANKALKSSLSRTIVAVCFGLATLLRPPTESVKCSICKFSRWMLYSIMKL